MTSAEPPRLQWVRIGIVIAGGALGSAAREGLALAIPVVAEVPLATATANVVGALALGFLYSALASRSHDDASARSIRLLVGTGFCGGFTTYSALANDTVLLAARGSVGTAALYAFGTLLVGAVATWLGIVAGARLDRPRERGAS